jgi:hypothetical protein
MGGRSINSPAFDMQPVLENKFGETKTIEMFKVSCELPKKKVKKKITTDMMLA